MTALIDLSKPVGLLMLGVVHHVHDDEDPAGLLRANVDRMVSGSHLFLTHFVDHGEETKPVEQVLLNELTRGPVRSVDEITSYFDGLELVALSAAPTRLGKLGAMPADPLAAAGEENVRERVRTLHVVEGGSGSPVNLEDGGEQLR